MDHPLARTRLNHPRIWLKALVLPSGLLSSIAGAQSTPAPVTPGRHRVEITSTADGSLQPSYLVIPKADAPAPRRRPLAVLLHTWSFDLEQRDSTAEAEIGANGWLLLAPNFRGRNDHVGACGSPLAQQDVMDAVAWTRAHYAVDDDRIYVLGLSGGGYMTMLVAARHPEVWAAASAWVGISDLRAWYADHSGDRYGQMMRGCFGGSPDDSPAIAEEFAARSPIRYLAPGSPVAFDLAAGRYDSTVSPLHTLRAFQALAPGALSDADVSAFMSREPGPIDSTQDPELGHRIFLRREASGSRLTIFDGGHEWASHAAVAWLAGHVRSAIEFVAHPIDTGLLGGYQVIATDVNRDGRPDLIAVAADLPELRWYENPGWQKHVLVTGIQDPINAAARDLDGDGVPEIALAHGFSNVYAEGPGIVSILTHQGDPAGPWSIQDIDRVPTSHRLRFADLDGTGRPVLVNSPLIGPKALAPDYRDRVPVLMYRPGGWKRDTITAAEEGVVHGLLPVRWRGARRESLLTAGFLGVHEYRFDRGRWTGKPLVAGDPRAWPQSGASDIAVGYLGPEPFLATIEPWHGNQVVVYRKVQGAWQRSVIDTTLADAHAIVVGDFDGDGRDEIVAGERKGRHSVYLYRAGHSSGDGWARQLIDDGHITAAGCTVADLNADRRPDVVCIGSATANLIWYENRSRR